MSGNVYVSPYNPVMQAGVRAKNPPDLVIASRAPTTSDYGYFIGTNWLYVGNSYWGLVSTSISPSSKTASWVEFGGTSGAISAVNGTTNQVAVVTSGNIATVSLAGPHNFTSQTANGVLIGEGTSPISSTAAGTDGQVLTGNTGADPSFQAIGSKSGLTAHGVILGEGSSAFAATAAGSAGQLLKSGGASADPSWTTATYPNTVAAGDLLMATAANAIGSLADVAVGQALMSGGVGVVPAYSGSPSFSGSVTAATSLTATLGNITATNGNLVLGTAGNKIVSTSVGTTTSAGANSFGSVTLSGGTATVATSAVTASSLIVIWRQSVGATGAAALGQLSVGTITAPTNFVINAWTTANATALATTDVSVVGWMIIN